MNLTAASKDFKGLKARLEGIAKAMAGNPQFVVKKVHVGAPFKGTPPDEAHADLVALATTFDGATLEWELKGAEKTSGKIVIPKLPEVLKTKGQGESDEETFVLIPEFKYAKLELPVEGEDASVIDLESGDSKTDGVSVLSAYDALVDSLGVKGWELRYYDDLGDDEEELFDVQGDILDAVDRAWAALGLKAP